MSAATWVYILLGLYIVYSFYEGMKGYFKEKTSAGYAIGGRSVPFIAFLMAATAASFSGWTFIGHPGLIWRDGLAYAFASFYVLTIPITGTFFAKRQWLLGKRYGFVTPGDMYAYYFNSEALRWLVVLTAVLYSVFYSAVQMMAAGALFNIITGVDFLTGALFLAFIVWFYVVTGGMKAGAWVGVLQFVLLVGGIIAMGYYVIIHPEFGGWSGFSAKLAKLDQKFLTVPEVITWGLGKKGAASWTSVMILTYMFSLMGIQSSPAFTMTFFGIKSPKPLAWQQTFMSTFVVGFALFYFTALQGMGAKVLEVAGVAAFQGLNDRVVVPTLMHNFLPPFMVGFVFMGAIAAIHSTAAPYINTGGSILLRDIYWRIIRKQEASDSEQIWVNRILTTVLTIAALYVGINSKAALVILGALATAFGFVMYVLLVGVCWGFKFPRVGAVLGVAAGMIAVYLTYAVWPNPLSMHCAFWGTFVGLVVAYLCKGLGIKDDQETISRQAEIRQWLDSVDAPTESQKKWQSAMKFVVPIWYFFAIGPACIWGNSAFSFAGFPPLWSWQIFWWTMGIVMMWALTFKAGLSTTNEVQLARAEKEQMLVVKE
ncbi:sodium:solute symporter family protein [Desulfatirhabdium butyrativorans]|uniref:sodium:solute symporter family protein n=1 Tax=Desulfatirhabdium butyrativorans TaxID=340467 RepID=UPI00040281E2|nr:sodium:solute symporter family protein [Desulfatirhabdium butyrativorans]